MFLLRTIFWLGLVLAIIPIKTGDLPEGETPVSPLETIGLAQSVASDIGRFCERNPQSCETGSRLFSQMGAKAREGARMAQAWLDEQDGADASAMTAANGSKVDPVSTGTVE